MNKNANKKINIAFIGAGYISTLLAETISKMKKDVNLYAIASRDMNKAKEFADKYGFDNYYGAYEDMLKDDNIDMPSRYMINDIIASGEIGNVTSLSANLGYVIADVDRIKFPELAGGALLDIGVYTINFALMVFGDNIKSIDSTCVKMSTGVDSQNSITITFDDDKIAVLYSTVLAITDRQAVINCDKGYMVIENINNPQYITTYSLDRKKINTYKVPKQITGYEYQVLSCVDAIRNNKLECSEMSHKDIIKVMNIMDSLRKKWKIKYPFE